MSRFLLLVLIPTLVCSFSIHQQNVEKTDLYIKEGFALVNEKISMDKEKGILILDVPDHNDIVASRVILDATSEFMLLLVKEAKQCQLTKKPKMFAKELEMFEFAKNERSNSNKPLKTNPQTTYEMELATNLGPKVSVQFLPENLRPYCPTDFDIYAAHMYLPKEEKPVMNDVYNMANVYDFPSKPLTNNTNHRQKRQAQENFKQCLDHDGNLIGGGHCDVIYGIECPSGNCGADETIFDCKRITSGHTCWYFTVPCNKLPRGEDWNTCIVHMRNTNQHCKMCCVNQSCCPSPTDPNAPECAMPKCSLHEK